MTPPDRPAIANGGRRANDNGVADLSSKTPAARRRVESTLLRRLGKRGRGGKRSLRILVAAAAAYAISTQFRNAFRTSDSPGSRHDGATFEPPGARGWESGKKDGGGRDPSSLTGRRRRDHDRADDADADAPDGKRTKPRRGNDENKSLRPSKRRPTTPSRRVPGMVALKYSKGLSVAPIKPKKSPPFEEDSVPTDGPRVEDSWFEPNADEFIDGYDWDVCEPMYDWQLASYPNCNDFHELDLRKVRVINTGGSRIAFELRQHLNGEEEKYVYKTVKYHKEITMRLVEEQRKDSLVLERTTKSKFIPDIHGYCSLGVMMDFMPEGNMHDYIKGARLAGGSTLGPVDRLKLSIHIATSVADLHTIDDTPMPSIFHNDICCHQYLFQNGIFKLNDFNYAKPIYVNKRTNERCTRSDFGMAMWKARSLEEHRRALGSRDFRPVEPDKIDIWMMGNLIYYMLTDLYTFEKPRNLSWRESGRELVAGRRTPYPKEIERSRDPAHVAVKRSLDMCWTQDPNERPSARSISDYLVGRLREIAGEEDPDLRVTLPKRDPDQGSSESDYDKYND